MVSQLPFRMARRASQALRIALLSACAVAWGSAGIGCGGGSDSNACADACIAAVQACQKQYCPPGNICICDGGNACLKRCYG